MNQSEGAAPVTGVSMMMPTVARAAVIHAGILPSGWYSAINDWTNCGNLSCSLLNRPLRITMPNSYDGFTDLSHQLQLERYVVYGKQVAGDGLAGHAVYGSTGVVLARHARARVTDGPVILYK